MTKEEAKLFFPYNEEDILSDLYDERLFEYKQFFLSKTPIRKVFEARLEKLNQLDKAYTILSGVPAVHVEILPAEPIIFSDVILEAFNQWEQRKGIAKQKIATSFDAGTLSGNVQEYLILVDAYRKKWYTEHEIPVEISQVSKDEDPMVVLEAIKAFDASGGKKFDDILKMNTNSFLLKEMKRLSLLIKNYGDGRSI
ncbi:hypothetical protein G5B10_09470 [Fluviicola sp. SGL-29]|nr:hypothetical protein [Fluviicola sp. SGL-29]